MTEKIMNKRNLNSKRKSGQVLILVLLVVVVSLAIGLSVASRNLSNLKISSQTDQSQRAYSVAENGVENVLAQLNKANVAGTFKDAITNGTTIVGPQDSAGNASSTTVASNTTYERQIAVGEVGQVSVDDTVGATIAKKYTIMWAKASSINECVSPASLEVTLVYLNSPNYAQRRWYLKGANGDGARSETLNTINGTTNSVDSTGATNTFSYTPSIWVGSGTCATSGGFPAASPACSPLYINCATIDTTTISPAITAGTRKLLRIRPLLVDTTVNVGPNTTTGQVLPTQEYVITSSATVGNGVTRKLLVQKSALPSVPAVFDFALYSEQDILK